MYLTWNQSELKCEYSLILIYPSKVIFRDINHNLVLKFDLVCRLCKTAQKLFESAEEAREKGDEETSYVQYMKYLRVIAYISKDKDYMKDKTYYTNMLGAKNPNRALDAAEKLKSSLIMR